MKEFVDTLVAAAAAPETPTGFYAVDPSFTEDEPLPVADPVLMAHLGGLAEHMATLCGREPPPWTEKSEYFLDAPFMSGGPDSLESTPSAFRRRLLFCGPALQKLHRLKPRPKASNG